MITKSEIVYNITIYCVTTLNYYKLQKKNYGGESMAYNLRNKRRWMNLSNHLYIMLHNYMRIITVSAQLKDFEKYKTFG